MPTAIANVISSWFGSAAGSATSSAAFFGTTNGRYGAGYDEKTSLQSAPLQTSLYFESEVPDGAVVTGVRLNFVQGGVNEGSSVRFRIGVMARDGLWDQTGWNTANYPTINDIPFPVTRPLSDYAYHDAVWHDSRFEEQLNSLVSSGSFVLGEGGVVDRSVDGLIAVVQGFLDDTTNAHRAFSGSGTAVPILLTLTAGTPLNQDAVQAVGAAGHPTDPPVLEIDWEFANTDPTISISTPADGSFHIGGSTIFLTGIASDAEDGDLSSSIQWSSDLDGALGSGATLEISTLSQGTHVITAEVTDAGSATAQDTVSFEVGTAEPATPIPPPTPPASPSVAFSQGVAYERDAVPSVTFSRDAGPSVSFEADFAPSVDFRSDAKQTVSAERDVRFVGDGVNE